VEWASVKKMREFVTSKGKLDDFVFNNEEMAAHGSDINDADFKDTYGCAPQIPEATRVDIILKGVAECERFSMVDHLFSTYDIENKSLVEVIRVLGNIEASSGGQDKLTNEIKEVTNKRKRDDNNGDNPKANLTIKKFPPGSCSVHRLATNHNNEMCFEQGNPRKFPWAPFAYCLKLGHKSAPTHTTDRCRQDPSSKSYVTGKVWNPPKGVRGTLPEPPEPLFVHHPLKISTWKFFVHLKEPSWRGLKNFHIEIFNSELKVSMRKFLFTQISILK
jgi:hypothetical protein